MENTLNRREILQAAGILGGVTVAAATAMTLDDMDAQNEAQTTVQKTLVNALEGKWPVNIDADKIADILAHNPEARARWNEAKASMQTIEQKAVLIMKEEGTQAANWTDRLFTPPKAAGAAKNS